MNAGITVGPMFMFICLLYGLNSIKFGLQLSYHNVIVIITIICIVVVVVVIIVTTPTTTNNTNNNSNNSVLYGLILAITLPTRLIDSKS